MSTCSLAICSRWTFRGGKSHGCNRVSANRRALQTLTKRVHFFGNCSFILGTVLVITRIALPSRTTYLLQPHRRSKALRLSDTCRSFLFTLYVSTRWVSITRPAVAQSESVLSHCFLVVLEQADAAQGSAKWRAR
jgi:hypothetical protein